MISRGTQQTKIAKNVQDEKSLVQNFQEKNVLLRFAVIDITNFSKKKINGFLLEKNNTAI